MVRLKINEVDYLSIFYPDVNLKSVTEISKNMLDQLEIKGIIIDIDNTLTGHNSQEISQDVLNWITNIRQDFPCVLLSNNFEKRVKSFADMLYIDYIHTAFKPVPMFGFSKAGKMLGKKPSELAVIGDQIFTDVWGGNWFGATTIRVEPIMTDETVSIGFKRKLEKKIMKRYYMREGKIK